MSTGVNPESCETITVEIPMIIVPGQMSVDEALHLTWPQLRSVAPFNWIFITDSLTCG